MSLRFFRNDPFIDSTLCDPVNTFTGDGETTQFVLYGNLNRFTVGALCSVNDTILERNQDAFTLDQIEVDEEFFDVINFASPPEDNSLIIVAGLNSLVLTSYETEGSRIIQKPFYLIDNNEIQIYEYFERTGQPGIEISFTDIYGSGQADPSWFQIAPANPDGTAGTYEAGGDSLFIDPIQAKTTLFRSELPLATEILLDDPDEFAEGDFITINAGFSTQEICRITELSGQTATITGFNFSHNLGETIHACGVQGWVKVTVPEDFTGGEGGVFLNIVPEVKALQYSRL